MALQARGERRGRNAAAVGSVDSPRRCPPATWRGRDALVAYSWASSHRRVWQKCFCRRPTPHPGCPAGEFQVEHPTRESQVYHRAGCWGCFDLLLRCALASHPGPPARLVSEPLEQAHRLETVGPRTPQIKINAPTRQPGARAAVRLRGHDLIFACILRAYFAPQWHHRADITLTRIDGVCPELGTWPTRREVFAPAS